jgi:hypothetical protein
MANNVASLISYTPPGISWTAPEKSRPWQNPPKLVNIGDVAGYYIDAIGAEETMNDMLDAIETGVPLAVVSEAMMMSGVSKGIHSLDTGILVMPVIIEMLQTISMIHGTKVVIYPDDYDKEATVSNRVARLAVQKAMKKVEGIDVSEAEQETLPEAPKGLMAKKQKEVV